MACRPSFLSRHRYQLSVNSGSDYGCDFRVDVARIIGKVDADAGEFPAWNDWSDLGKG